MLPCLFYSRIQWFYCFFMLEIPICILSICHKFQRFFRDHLSKSLKNIWNILRTIIHENSKYFKETFSFVLEAATWPRSGVIHYLSFLFIFYFVFIYPKFKLSQEISVNNNSFSILISLVCSLFCNFANKSHKLTSKFIFYRKYIY